MLIYKQIRNLYVIYMQIYTLIPYPNVHNVQQILSFQLHKVITRIIINLRELQDLMHILLFLIKVHKEIQLLFILRNILEQLMLLMLNIYLNIFLLIFLVIIFLINFLNLIYLSFYLWVWLHFHLIQIILMIHILLLNSN